MTEAVLAWQALIFASIGLAGRWRGWVTAFWVAWTILQVFALPLSLIQFGTIAVAAALFRSKTAAKPSPPVALEPAAPVTAAKTIPLVLPPAPTESALATFAAAADGMARKANAWAVDLERKTAAWAQEQKFRLAAQQQIKTEGFSCALEERVMKEALARDQQLTRELQTELARDSVLAKLHHAALARCGSLDTVQSRQVAERAALDAARSTRQMLDTIIDNGPEFRRHYFDALKKTADVLKDSAPADDPEAHLMEFGRHLSDWLAEVEALRAAQLARKQSIAQAVDALFASSRVPPPAASPPVAVSSIAAPVVEQQSVACVTRNTFKRVGMGLSPAGVSLDAVFAYIYRKSLASILNQAEAKSLYVLRCLFQGKADELAVPEKTFSPIYVFSVTPPKYHVSVNCEYLTADFINYLVPPEIKAQGADRVRAFQQLCEEKKTLLKDKPYAFWAHVGAEFGISSQPRRVQYTNSGVHELAQGLDLNELQLRIDDAIAEAEGMIAPGLDGGVVANNRYAPNPKRVLASVDDPLARELVQKFFDLKRDLLDLLFEFYRRESGNADLFLPVVLLEAAGLAPCRGCSIPPRHRPGG